MHFCHGAPGFVICLADLPGQALDDLLLKAGQAIWAAGPLRKGSNLCHGTGGKGHAFLQLWRRTQESVGSLVGSGGRDVLLADLRSLS